MSKVKLVSLLGLVVAIIASMVILPACAEEAAPEVVTETVTETVVETVTETVEVEKESPYTYEKLREMANAGAYEGEPAKGHTLAFANFSTSFPFCKSVEDSIIEQWQLAGGSMDDLTVLDNAYDITLAVQNVDIVFNKKPEVFLQFFFDAKFNAMTARRAEDLGIFCIAIDIPLPGFPFMGVDNYGTAVLTGNWAVEQIEKEYGSIENIDLIMYHYAPQIGETVALRFLGTMDVFIEKWGDIADPGDPETGEKPEASRAIWAPVGSTTDETQAAITSILAAYPEAENIVVVLGNDQTSAGAQAGAEIAGRWDPDKWFITSQGVDELGMQLIREGVVDGDSAYFPENYGEYCVPGALAHMYGNPVPSHLFVENVIVTIDNIDEYYPE